MAFCRKCGKEIYDDAVICPHCGVQVAPLKTDSVDSGSGGWTLLSLIFPIIGLILAIMWRKSRPKNARACIHGVIAIIVIIFALSTIVGLVLSTQATVSESKSQYNELSQTIKENKEVRTFQKNEKKNDKKNDKYYKEIKDEITVALDSLSDNFFDPSSVTVMYITHSDFSQNEEKTREVAIYFYAPTESGVKKSQYVYYYTVYENGEIDRYLAEEASLKFELLDAKKKDMETYKNSKDKYEYDGTVGEYEYITGNLLYRKFRNKKENYNSSEQYYYLTYQQLSEMYKYYESKNK